LGCSRRMPSSCPSSSVEAPPVSPPSHRQPSSTSTSTSYAV
jgi:hypothetical protein